LVNDDSRKRIGRPTDQIWYLYPKRGFMNEEMRQKTGVAYDKKERWKSNSHYKQDDAVAVAIISYIGRRMIKINYFFYSQR
jgi:hypothetical protein